MDQTTEEMQAWVEELIPTFYAYAENVISAILILIVGYWIANRLGAVARKAVDRHERIDATIKPLAGNTVKYLVLAITIVAVLGQFGIQTASIIAVLGAAGLAVGLALQGTLQNIAAGVMLLSLRPLKVGEFVDVGGILGTIEEIGLVTTRLTTYDGIFVQAPNSMLWNTAVTNYSRNPTRRLDFTVGISYGDDIEAAQAALMKVMEGDSRVLKDPEPMTMVLGLGDSSVDINMRCWVGNDDFWPAKWDLQKAAKLAVEAAGCTIPFPQRDVHHIGAPAGGPETAAKAG